MTSSTLPPPSTVISNAPTVSWSDDRWARRCRRRRRRRRLRRRPPTRPRCRPPRRWRRRPQVAVVALSVKPYVGPCRPGCSRTAVSEPTAIVGQGRCTGITHANFSASPSVVLDLDVGLDRAAARSTNRMFSPVWSTGIGWGPASQNVPPQAWAEKTWETERGWRSGPRRPRSTETSSSSFNPRLRGHHTAGARLAGPTASGQPQQQGAEQQRGHATGGTAAAAASVAGVGLRRARSKAGYERSHT